MSDITGGNNDTQSILVTNQQRAASADKSTQKATIDILPKETQERLQARIEKAQSTQGERQASARTSVKGEVIAHDPEDRGRYTIKTEDGDITLRTQNPRQERPAIGQNVQIDIPAQGEAPVQQTEVYIRPQSPAPQNIDTPRVSATPVDINIPLPEDTAQPIQPTPDTAALLRSITTYITPIPADTPIIPFDDPQAPLPPTTPQNTTLPAPSQTTTAFITQTEIPSVQTTLSAPTNLAAPPITQTSLADITAPQDATIPQLPAAIANFTAQPLLLLTAQQISPPNIPPTTPQQKTQNSIKTQVTVPPEHIIPAPNAAQQNAQNLITTQASITTAQSTSTPQQTTLTTINIPSTAIAFSAPSAANSPIINDIHALLSNHRAEEKPATWLGFAKQAAQETSAPAKDSTNPQPVLSIPQGENTPHTYRSIYAASTHAGAKNNTLFLMHTALPASAPSGASLTITPQTQTSGAPESINLPNIPSGTPALPILAPILFNAQPWDTLNALHQTLQQAAPQSAAMLASATPNTGNLSQMMPAALFFISAIKGGDIQNWMSEKTVEILKKAGKGKALAQFTHESSALSRLASEPSGDWRTHALPLYHDGTFHKILLHARQDAPSDDQDNPKGKLTRFIFDLSLHHIGPVQLDGLFKGNRLDVILRTEQHFSQNMQAHMRRLYKGALDQTQINGDLSFQNRADSWVTIQEDTSKTLTQNA